MTLAQAVADHPYPDYAEWWKVGDEFIRFMQNAIVPEWRALADNDADAASVSDSFEEYIDTVYGKQSRTHLVADAVSERPLADVWSGEFDALSYAFYRAAFTLMEQNASEESIPLSRQRRAFTQRVGRRFFDQVAERLSLDLPSGLYTQEDFDRLRASIEKIGDFLRERKYLRDHFAFRFDLDIEHSGTRVRQRDSDVPGLLNSGGTAHALYEMGYPIILPSAVYLYHTMGEAQHHSSRIIEELFRRVGYKARETDDFDPTGFPSDLVVEFWEIRAAKL